MNLILFEKHEINTELSLDDPRAIHIISVLRRTEGESFDAGIVNGPRGKGIIRRITPVSLKLDFVFPDQTAGNQLFPVILVTGLPRPQTARKILREATSLGVSSIYFTCTDRGEASYKKSRLWTTGEYKKHLISGAEQAFCTSIPDVRLFNDLDTCIQSLSKGERIALDNYEAGILLKDYTYTLAWTNLLVGPENGWSGGERNLLRRKGFILAGLGKRVLRTETAAVAGIALVLAGMDLF